MFQRLGESTDVVRKEMYDFEDKGGRHDRPAPGDRPPRWPGPSSSTARRCPWKCWYAGSNFRYERPQAGRYREFHQVGIEAFGSADPDLDVEVIALGWEFYDAVGLDQRPAAAQLPR